MRVIADDQLVQETKVRRRRFAAALPRLMLVLYERGEIQFKWGYMFLICLERVGE